MRTRLFIISGLAVAAVLGASSFNTAQAQPNGPGDLSPTPTTMGPPKPTTTTVPKGPDDIAPKPPTGDDPKPEGPDDLAPAPKHDGGVEPGPDTTGNGSGSDNYVPPAYNGVGEPVVASDLDGDGAAANQDADYESARLPLFGMVFVAALLGALIALVATRLRRDDENADRV